MSLQTMREFGIGAHARAEPGRIAIVSAGTLITYGELVRRARKWATVFAGKGAGEGSRITIALRNRPEFFEIAAAASILGAEVVPAGARLSKDELAYLVEDSQSIVVVTEEDDLQEARDSATEFDGEPSTARFRTYTSGTTGRPKAIVRPPRGPDEYRAFVATYPPLQGVTEPDNVHLVCGPLYHTAPLAFAQYALLFGHTVVLIERFDARECLETIERERVTWSHMVPINFARILEVPETRDLSSVRKIIHAAAPCPPEIKRRIIDLFPPGTIWEYYGATEGFASIISPAEWLRKPGSVGRGDNVRIIGDTGEDAKPGETGLIYIKGAPFHYDGARDKTEAAWRGDSFTVGDMGYIDDDGYLFLTDRRIDMIISGGANVYPAEVEAALQGHPAVSDVAVVGVPDDEWGERVLAIVEARAKTSEAALIEFCRDRIAHFKCPREIVFVDRLPRDENGKVRKRDLREPYWAGRTTKI